MTLALVTGGSGFIGQHLIKQLQTRGVDVRATARDKVAANVLSSLGANVQPWSFEDSRLADSLFGDVNIVFHLAYPRRVREAVTNHIHRVSSEVALKGTRDLLQAFKRSRARRFVLSSSTQVYGNVWGVASETYDAYPTSEYGKMRLSIERLVEQSLRDCANRYVIARLPETFGPGSPMQRDILQAIASRNFRLIGSGSVMHHLSTVQDAVEGLLACATVELAGGKTFNIGSDPRPLRAFVEAAVAAAGVELKSSAWASWPAHILLKAFYMTPLAKRLAPQVFYALDYQMRPRGFDVSLSKTVLGNYQKSDFEKTVAASLQAAIA